MYNNYIFLDTETTGTSKEDRLCQVAYLVTDLAGLEMERVDLLTKPEVPVGYSAMEINHITNEMLEDKQPFAGSEEADKLNSMLTQDGNVLVAHNVNYDRKMLKRDGVDATTCICTDKVMRRLDPFEELGPKRLQYLRYALDLNDPDARPHDALGDVLILKNLYFYAEQLAREKTSLSFDPAEDPAAAENQTKIIDRFIQISKEPSLMARFPFGKYKGELIAYNKDKSYMEWMINKTDMFDDYKWTIKKYHFPEWLKEEDYV